MEQRIKVDENGCLVITTDNGKRDALGFSAEIVGDFTINADDVLRLLKIADGSTLKDFEIELPWGIVLKRGVVITDNKDFCEAVEHFRTQENILRHKHSLLRDEFAELKKKIKQFNASRRLWERKFDLE